jgi:hypothetical protein
MNGLAVQLNLAAVARAKTNHSSFCFIRAPFQGVNDTPPALRKMQPRYSRRINFDRCAGISLPGGGKMIPERRVKRRARQN